ncbi:ABC transporter permease [Ulvibacterium marinum]|uniref:FtsX-like permease family protein n=1 Tax=Ulvibacterium marinum TaxID=2419782 RepID=A0A3B0CAH8_9FLAO|nr:ABC transporter permease [Ulvibacterium marinum]RKN82912.1 FtsX-like permease family protein [Ulvibacterium marinum]
MLKHHIKIAWRNLLRNKGYSAINIGGLAMGMAVVMMIGLWVMDEFTFNSYHKNNNRIAQIYERAENQDTGEIQVSNAMMHVTGTVLKENYQDHFKHILRAFWILDYTLGTNGKTFTQTGEFIEDGALEMLSLSMVEGTYASLEKTNALVLSQSAALVLFGEEDPMGKPIKINNSMDAVVTGIYKDLPKNTSFENVQFFANWDLFEAQDQGIASSRDTWDNYSYNLYVELKPESDFESVDEALNNFFIDYAPKEFARLEKYHPKLFMHTMNKWHLYSEFEQGKATRGRITFVWLFIGIAVFVLFLACINFMNLSTARSEKRAKEIGVRKAVGSGRKQLIHQFLGESLLVSGMALLCALLLVFISLPWFNEIADKNMGILWGNPWFWSMILVFTLITGLLAGSYPALYLSSFTPLKAFRGTFKAGSYTFAPRKVLVVFQLSVSLVLAIGTIIVFGQIQFTQDRPIGYNHSNLLTVDMNNPNYSGKYNLLRTELKNTGVVEEMAQCSSPLSASYTSWGGFDWQGKDPERDTSFNVFQVTHDYGETIGWEFLEGRDFSREFASDSTAIVINERAVEYMGLENPVGTFISRQGQPLKIIGVTKNMITDSPYNPVKQAVFFMDYTNTNFIHIKIKPDVGAQSAIARIASVFAEVVPSANFDYKFVDQEYGRKFESEQRLGNLAGVFTLLAIFISCLGLFGLASFTAEQRTKEIGVRKVLGASVYNLWQMLSKDFVALVLISCLIAIPIAYHFMGRWLQGYEYRVDISWEVFGLAIFGALLVTLLTVSFQAIRAANANPVKSLRTE